MNSMLDLTEFVTISMMNINNNLASPILVCQMRFRQNCMCKVLICVDYLKFVFEYQYNVLEVIILSESPFTT